jgi:hypothetical protein
LTPSHILGITKEFGMKTIIAATILTFTAMNAYAAVPEGAKLSEIIDYYLNSGAKVEVKIDPKTGETVK